MSDFIEELVPAATLSADARHVKLHVVPAERGVSVDADREVLAAVMMNLLQNAFKFTRPRSTVTLRGTVRSYAEKQEAARVAWSAPGVKAVENHIQVAP